MGEGKIILLSGVLQSLLIQQLWCIFRQMAQDKIKINGEPSVSMVENTQFISYEKGYLVYEFGSGSYNIVAMKE